MATIVIPEAMYFGAPASLTVGGIEVGATLDNPKVAMDRTVYTPEFKNAGGPVEDTDINTRAVPRLECLVNELTAVKLAWAMPGCTSVVGTAAETGGGCTGTLYADVAAGATNIKVTSVTSLAEGDFLKIGDAGETEIHEVATVGTVNGGTGVTLVDALLRDHDAGDAYVEVDDAGTTIITWTLGRIPSAAYKDVVATGVGLDGRQMIVTIKKAISTEPLEFTMGDDAMVGLPLKLVGRYAKATPRLVPFELELG